jgi:hypothetical protein
MHAIIGVFKMDRSKTAEQRVELHERIIPMVKQLQGFVSGYWSYDPATNQHFAHVVFDSAEGAEKLAAFVGSEPRRLQGKQAGVENESLTVVEVIGDARGA